MDENRIKKGSLNVTCALNDRIFINTPTGEIEIQLRKIAGFQVELNFCAPVEYNIVREKALARLAYEELDSLRGSS